MASTYREIGKTKPNPLRFVPHHVSPTFTLKVILVSVARPSEEERLTAWIIHNSRRCCFPWLTPGRVKNEERMREGEEGVDWLGSQCWHDFNETPLRCTKGKYSVFRIVAHLLRVLATITLTWSSADVKVIPLACSIFGWFDRFYGQFYLKILCTL